MNFWAELGVKISQTIRQGRLPIDKLADEICVSENLLYQNAKYFNDFGGKSPTLQTIVLTMDRQQDYNILKHISRRFGYHCSKILPYPKNKETHIERAFQLHKRYMNITSLFTEYIKNPVAGILQKIIIALDDCICYEQAILRTLRTQNGQLDLFEK